MILHAVRLQFNLCCPLPSHLTPLLWTAQFGAGLMAQAPHTTRSLYPALPAGTWMPVPRPPQLHGPAQPFFLFSLPFLHLRSLGVPWPWFPSNTFSWAGKGAALQSLDEPPALLGWAEGPALLQPCWVKPDLTEGREAPGSSRAPCSVQAWALVGHSSHQTAQRAMEGNASALAAPALQRKHFPSSFFVCFKRSR